MVEAPLKTRPVDYDYVPRIDFMVSEWCDEYHNFQQADCVGQSGPLGFYYLDYMLSCADKA